MRHNETPSGPSVRVLREYERGVIFRLGRLIAEKEQRPLESSPDDDG